MSKKNDETKEIMIPPITKKRATFHIVGVTPIIFNRFTDASLDDIGKKQEGVAQGARKKRDPEALFRDSLHWMGGKPREKPTQRDLEKCCFGIPTSAFKKSSIAAIRYVEGMAMVATKGLFYPTHDLAEIKGSTPHLDSRWVRMNAKGPNSGTITIAHRSMIDEWECDLDLLYDADLLTPDQLASILNRAGFSVGVGAFRPESGGTFGMFEVK